jgi:serine/threonine protein kinase
MAMMTLLAMANAQAAAAQQTEYGCTGSIKEKFSPLSKDPCEKTPAYSQISACGSFIMGNVSTPSADCCAGAQSVWSNFPACFCKVTFLSIFPDPGPVRALERPLMCNITDDLCNTCSSALADYHTDYGCAAGIPAKYKEPAKDPCADTMAYTQLGECTAFVQGNVTAPSPACCAAAQNVYANLPACFCKVTFFSIFPDPGPARGLERPHLCNITDDLCKICPAHFESIGSKVTIVAAAVGTSIAAVLFLIGCVFLVCCRKRVFRRHYENKEYAQQCNDIKNIEGKPTIFPYHVLKHATKNFSPENKLGEGGFGSVFKGVLPDGMEVAVKQLSAKSQQGNDEFLNEVTLITSVQHRNLVKLRGCCLKAEERLLVYEYLENKSLHQALFDKPRLQMDWQTRMKILEGTARGLAYLHEGCHTRIVHRDIKASNILLDKDLNPKIADFGLARIFSENDTHVSTRVAGTAGYLAPEYAMRGQLTEKADVFSYGIVVLELVSGRANLDLHLQPHAVYLLDWAWQLYEENQLTDLLDPAISWSQDTLEESLRVVEMALLCTHSRTTLRPTMTTVVSILTGGSEVAIPKFARFDVRNYSDLDFKFSGSQASSKQTDSRIRSYSSHGGDSTCSNNTSGVVSILEPR